MLDCFVRPDGSIEAHAAGCAVCQDKALDAAAWSAEGLPPAEARQRLVARCRDFGPST